MFVLLSVINRCRACPDKVGRLDYAYTLQGWLKGINSTGGQRNHDMGEDGQNGALHRYTGRDAYALTLNYFGGEYASINHSVSPFPDYRPQLSTAYRPLFNGNISSSSVYSKRFEDPDISGGPNIFYNYRYDQLNRLTGQDAYIGFDTALNNWSSWMAMPDDRLQERVAYDANGNILKYFRNALGGSSPDMDSLNYYYYPGTNQLRRVTDAIPDNQYRSEMNDIIRDLDNQPENNYAYDQIGNLIKDSLEQISNIKWSVYGKILEVTRTATDIAPSTTIKFTYDAQGNRISKVTDAGGELNYTWYVRDAQGNVITTYTANGNDPNLWALPLSQSERYMYGSSRLGVYSDILRVDGPDGSDSTGPDRMWGYNENIFLRGLRQYELSNHLGNVLATISDKKFAVPSALDDSLADYFEPDIRSAFDYYPFGMMSRIAPNPDDVNYRYGFNGKEMDHEVKGSASSLDYGMRIYDPRVGRFLSVDPLVRNFPSVSPYAFAENNPIVNVDLDGQEKFHYIFTFTDKGVPTLTYSGKEDLVESDLDGTLGVFSHPFNEGDKINARKAYDVKFTFNTWAVAGVVAVQYDATVVVDYNTDPAKLEINQVVKDVDKAIERFSDQMAIRQGIASGIFARANRGRRSSTHPEVPEEGAGPGATQKKSTDITTAPSASKKQLEVETYGTAVKKNTGTGFNADHIPSFAAMKRMREQALGRQLTAKEAEDLKNSTLTLSIEKELHQSTSQTYGGRNNATRQQADAADPIRAIKENVNAYRAELLKKGYTNQDIDRAIEELAKPFRNAQIQQTQHPLH